MRKAVLYDSNTGNTRAMAEAIADGVRESGDDLYFCNVGDADLETALSCDVLYLGCPAMGVEMVGDAQTDFCRAVGMRFRGKRVVIFGSCEHSDGMWLRKWAQQLRAWGADVVNPLGLKARLHPDSAVLEECLSLGRL